MPCLSSSFYSFLTGPGLNIRPAPPEVIKKTISSGLKNKKAVSLKRETAAHKKYSGGGIISLRRHDPDQVQRVIRFFRILSRSATPRCTGPDQFSMTRPFLY
jgi:hypothetical protein